MVYEHDNGSLGSIRRREFLVWLRKVNLLRSALLHGVGSYLNYENEL
jgi:hypothetical protein